MRIAHVYDTLDPRNGGPPFVIAGLAEGQRRLGHELVIISADPPICDPVDGFLRAHIAGPYHRASCQPWQIPTLAKALAGVEAVHLHGLWPPLVNAAAQICAARRQPYVLAPHGMLSPSNFGQKGLKKRAAMRALGYRRVIQRAGVLHALNPLEAEAIRAWGLARRVQVLPNGVLPEQFDELPAPGRFRFFHREVGEDPFILFLGRLHPQKGLDLLAEAFALAAARHPTLRWVIAGPDKGDKTRLQAQLRQLGVADRAHLVGPLYGPDKLMALVDSAAFCLTSKEEGFSVAITEALACGRPAVITDSCNFPEVAEVDAGRVTPRRAEAVAEAILEVIQRPDRLAMGARGRALVLERFTWPAIAGRSIQLYEDAR